MASDVAFSGLGCFHVSTIPSDVAAIGREARRRSEASSRGNVPKAGRHVAAWNVSSADPTASEAATSGFARFLRPFVACAWTPVSEDYSLYLLFFFPKSQPFSAERLSRPKWRPRLLLPPSEFDAAARAWRGSAASRRRRHGRCGSGTSFRLARWRSRVLPGQRIRCPRRTWTSGCATPWWRSWGIFPRRLSLSRSSPMAAEKEI